MTVSKLKTKQIVEEIRSNLNNNGSMKALYRQQLLSKFSEQELRGIRSSIDKHLNVIQRESILSMARELAKKGVPVNEIMEYLGDK